MQFLLSMPSDGEFFVLLSLAFLVLFIMALVAILKIPALLRAQQANNRLLGIIAAQGGADKDTVAGIIARGE